jgi:hypothetical protein
VASAQDAVNLRRGPGTNFNVVERVPTGSEVQVLARSEDGAWYRVRVFSTGATGWLSAQILYIQEGADDVPVDQDAAAKFPIRLRPLWLQVTETPEATVSSEATEGVESMTSGATDPMERRDERWYAMTMGIIASSTIIAVGAATNLARGLARRRRR